MEKYSFVVLIKGENIDVKLTPTGEKISTSMVSIDGWNGDTTNFVCWGDIASDNPKEGAIRISLKMKETLE